MLHLKQGRWEQVPGVQDLTAPAILCMVTILFGLLVINSICCSAGCCSAPAVRKAGRTPGPSGNVSSAPNEALRPSDYGYFVAGPERKEVGRAWV